MHAVPPASELDGVLFRLLQYAHDVQQEPIIFGLFAGIGTSLMHAIKVVHTKSPVKRWTRCIVVYRGLPAAMLLLANI